MGSGAGSAVTGDDEPSTFPKPPFRGLHTLTRALGNAEPASPNSSSAPAAASASGFHIGSFPLEAFPDTFASNAIPLFRARNGSLVARAQAADDGADAKKEPSKDAEDASDGDSDTDDDAYDVPGAARGSSGDSGVPAPGVPKKAAGEEDDSERRKKERRAFFASRPELARSVVAFSETAEMLCLLTAGGVRVAQLAQVGRERLQAASVPKRSANFVAAVAAPAPAPAPSALSLGRIGSVADGALVAAVGVHAMIKRLVGKNNIVPLGVPALGNVAAVPALDDAAQFADVVSRVRARAALLADVKKDLASSRLQAQIAAKAASRASEGAVTETSTSDKSDDVSASPSLAAARLEAKLAREAAEATARHREIEVSAANARAAAAEEMAQAARARAAEAEAMLARRAEMERRDEWQTETEVRTINTTRSTRGGSGFASRGAYDASGASYGNQNSAYGSRSPTSRGGGSHTDQNALNAPDQGRSMSMSDLVMDASAAVDAETRARGEEVARLRRAAAVEAEDECGFEDGYEGGQPFDECQ